MREETELNASVRLLNAEIVEDHIFSMFEIQRVLFVFGMAFDRTHLQNEIREFNVADMMFGQRLDDRIAAADGVDTAQGDVTNIIDGFVVGQIDAENIETRLRFDVAEEHVLDGERLDFRIRRGSVFIARWITLILTKRLDARRCHVNANPAVTNDKIAKRAIAHEIVVRPTNADAVARTLQHAVCDGNVLTGLRFVKLLLHAADDDTVVTICEIAVADDDIAAGSEMDAVAVRHAEVSLHRDAANENIFAV